MAISETVITAIQTEVSALRVLVEEIQRREDNHEKRTEKLEKVIISGDGDRLPLAELVRNLSKTVSDYIAQKDKEEQISRDNWNKVKWIVLGVIIPAVMLFIGQAFVFYFRIYPAIEKLIK